MVFYWLAVPNGELFFASACLFFYAYLPPYLSLRLPNLFFLHFFASFCPPFFFFSSDFSLSVTQSLLNKRCFFFFFNHWSFLRMCRFRPMSKMLCCIRLQEKFLGHSYIKIYIEGSFFWKLKNNMYMLMVVFPHTMDISSENV